MNAYYQGMGSRQWNCDFEDSGLIALTDPSYADCAYSGGDTVLDLSTSGKWCVAKPMTSDDMLQANVDFACNHVDCGLIRYGGGCYYPDTLINHASVIMNLYYQANGREDMSCYFKNTGCIVMKDPTKLLWFLLRSGDDLVYFCSDLVSFAKIRENGVAKPMTSDDMIQANINFACNYVDCSLIRHGGGCYHPDTLINHASVIMNLYYQAFGRENSSCDFKNTGCIVMKDPSYGNFKYKYQ
nr:glucan endo-1,3-beta-glucosidase [Quercus suber]